MQFHIDQTGRRWLVALVLSILVAFIASMAFNSYREDTAAARDSYERARDTTGSRR